ncbi:MAG: hypothetical protein J3K34DRAFT_403115 [Monoraphidium minutum]|nr:MAG: hypothetical protein J3K34DRAFT_403115 [Monoraphidium minutum]
MRAAARRRRAGAPGCGTPLGVGRGLAREHAGGRGDRRAHGAVHGVVHGLGAQHAVERLGRARGLRVKVDAEAGRDCAGHLGDRLLEQRRVVQLGAVEGRHHLGEALGAERAHLHEGAIVELGDDRADGVGERKHAVEVGVARPDGGQEEAEHRKLLHHVARDCVHRALKLGAGREVLERRLHEVVVDDLRRLGGRAARGVLGVVADGRGADDLLDVDLEAGLGVLEVDDERPRLQAHGVGADDDALLHEVAHEVLNVEPGVSLKLGQALLSLEVAVVLVDERVEAHLADRGGRGAHHVGGHDVVQGVPQVVPEPHLVIVLQELGVQRAEQPQDHVGGHVGLDGDVDRAVAGADLVIPLHHLGLLAGAPQGAPVERRRDDSVEAAHVGDLGLLGRLAGGVDDKLAAAHLAGNREQRVDGAGVDEGVGHRHGGGVRLGGVRGLRIGGGAAREQRRDEGVRGAPHLGGGRALLRRGAGTSSLGACSNIVARGLR